MSSCLCAAAIAWILIVDIARKRGDPVFANALNLLCKSICCPGWDLDNDVKCGDFKDLSPVFRIDRDGSNIRDFVYLLLASFIFELKLLDTNDLCRFPVPVLLPLF
ncbi:hypothetical protein AYI69_g5093 [Smittium culicis]|uniref:Uncharacterized protein n=1 Tax=Smittium culicis TaxID=133412 RepID=A0A1R1Y872_9FUNG|nr:hypothetical protein AYI69_g5093 [Smittium culicis]